MMSKSGGMAAAAAMLAVCMAGSAFAQNPPLDRAAGYVQQRSRSDGVDRAREAVRPQPQSVARGYLQPYADWHRGGRLPARSQVGDGTS